MPFSLFGGYRRTRLVAVAVFLTVSILFLAVPDRQPWGITGSLLPSDPPKPPPRVHGDGLRGPNPNGLNAHGEAFEREDDRPKTPEKPLAAADPPPAHATSASGAALASSPTLASTATATQASPTRDCMGFEAWQNTRPGPLSQGKRQFPSVRPPYECRTFHLPALEDLLEKMKGVIKDPDLYRLFENAYPNTLDTMVKWRGYAKKEDPLTRREVDTDEELAYVITGDIDAMWLRDSASQLYSYLPLLEASTSPDSLASLWRGLINAHARYITISPYCHSFQPPPESGIPPTKNGAFNQNHPMPPYDPAKVFDCKWELDSLASFLQVSSAYYQRTGDADFFGRHGWVPAVAAAVDAAGAMRRGTYGPDGAVLPSAWTFTGWTNRGSETLTNDGLGNPVRENGMVRSAFRPSDDACIFQLLVPANMMWAKYLEDASLIMERLARGNDGDDTAANLTAAMREQARGIRAGIDRDAVVRHRDFGDVFAYEIDGFGGANLMDDANVPSLLAMPLWNFTRSAFPPGGGGAEPPPPPRDHAAIYRNTRRFVLSAANPYWSQGPALSAVGGPHLGPGRGWPMAALVAGLTALDPLAGLAGDGEAAVDEAVGEQLRQVLDSTAGTGVIHESVHGFDDRQWTRAWFGWANGLLGELVLRIAEREKGRKGKGEGLLGRSWQ